MVFAKHKVNHSYKVDLTASLFPVIVSSTERLIVVASKQHINQNAQAYRHSV